MPRNRILYDLPVDSRVTAELVLAGPLLQVEEVAEELESFVFREQLKSDGTPEVSLQQRGCFL
jgi:hypothetical protein